jgi:hypothetical protein
LRSPAEATLRAFQMIQFQSAIASQPSPSQSQLSHRPPPLQSQEVLPPMTANVPHARGLQTLLNNRPIRQGMHAPIVIPDSPVRTQHHTSSQLSGSGNVSLQSAVVSRSTETQVRGPEYQNQRQNYAQIRSPDTPSGNSPYSPALLPEQVRLQSNGEGIPLPSSLIQAHMPPDPSGKAIAPSDMNGTHISLPPVMPSLKPRIATIQAHIAAAGGNNNLNNGLERPRFQLLMDACDCQDIFYVVLHQIFCVWDYDQEQIINIRGLPARDILSTAFSILGQLIRHNEGMATNHLRWFSRFPSPLDFLWATSEAYQHVVADVGLFLTKLASQWASFSRQCHSRRYPPLVDELVNGLGILSPILQGVVFTATRRNLGFSDDQFGQGAGKIFNEDKRGYQELSARYYTQQPPAQEEILQRNQELASRYYALTNQQPHRGTQSRVASKVVTSPLSRPPMLANNVHSSTTFLNPEGRQVPVRFSSNMERGTRNPNPQSPDPIPNQQTQPGTGTSGSPNPLPATMSGSTPIAADQLSHSGNLNMTFLQNLSILSPVVLSSASPSPVTSTPISPLQRQMQQSPPNLRSNSNQNLQNQNAPLHSTTTQGRIASSTLQRAGEHWIRQQQALQLSSLQGGRQATRVPSIPARQQQASAQTVSRAARQTVTQHQLVGVNRNAQLRSSSLPQPQSQSRSNSSGRSTNSFTGLGAEDTMKQQIQAYNSIQPPILRPLVPPLGYTHPPQPPNPDITALHQAHARSPNLVHASILRNDKVRLIDNPRYFQSVKGFALKPSMIPHTAHISKFEFTITEQDMALIAKDKLVSQSPRAVRAYEEGTLQYRLRCVRAKQDATAYSISEWTVSDTVWPETVFIRINDDVMEIRRKSHHAKDLPIDITSFIRIATPGQGSMNQVKISTPRSSKYNDRHDYFVAIEVIEILERHQIIDMCHQQRIPASETFESVRKALAGPTTDDDDEILMVVSDLSVSLADPFTARVFDIPVRGSSCLHRECFDLNPFLETRKAKRIGQPMDIDVWKCPLCGGDARPYVLQIDDFFVNVRAKLMDDDKLNVKAIWISADGSWRPKPESSLKRNAGNIFDDEDDEEGPAAKQRILDDVTLSGMASTDVGQGIRSVNRVVEVIELDDD